MDRLVPADALSGWRVERDFVGPLPVVEGVGAAVGDPTLTWLAYHRDRLARL